MCGCVIGVNCEVTPISKVLFQLLLVIPRCCFPPAASQTQQINTVLIACKLTVVYWEIREKQEKHSIYTLVLSPQIDDSDSNSDYSDDDVMARGRSEPETKPILSVREYRDRSVHGK